MSNLITDRLPTADDGDNDGDVRIKRRPDGPDIDTTVIHWSYVKPGTPWNRTSFWRPKRELPGVNGQWIRASAVKPTAADADGEGEVQVCGQERVWRHLSAVSSDCLWRPSPAKDRRPVEPAGQRLPGCWGEMISGWDALPTAEDADRDGDVVLPDFGRMTFRHWASVGRHEHWRPSNTKDTRPSRSN